jgi:hypothetical protein
MIADRADQSDLASRSFKSESLGWAIPLIRGQCHQVSNLFKASPYCWNG